MTAKGVLPKLETVAKHRQYGVLVYNYGCWCTASEDRPLAEQAVYEVGPHYDALDDEPEAKSLFLRWVKDQRLKSSTYDQYVPWMGRLFTTALKKYDSAARKAGCTKPFHPSFALQIAPELDPGIVQSVELRLRDSSKYAAVVKAQGAWDEYIDSVDLVANKLPVMVKWSKTNRGNIKNIETFKQLVVFVQKSDDRNWKAIIARMEAYATSLPPGMEIGLGVFTMVIIPITDPVTDVAGAAMIADGMKRWRGGDTRKKNPVSFDDLDTRDFHARLETHLHFSGTLEELLLEGARRHQPRDL